MQLRTRGAVLGVDAGFSHRRSSTGFCRLWWDADFVDWGFVNATVEQTRRRDALRQLFSGVETAILAVAVDGPLRPGLEVDAKHYRAAECILSRGAFQRRGKPGQTHAGSGPALHYHATVLAHLSLTECSVGATTLLFAILAAAVAEAFPNMFLGVLCDEQAYPNRPLRRRYWTDVLYPLVQTKLRQMLLDLLANRQIVGDWELEDHEKIGAFACALTALGFAAGRCVAVGSHEDGFMILPPLELWGYDSTLKCRWAERELRRNLADVGGPGGRFAKGRACRDGKEWLPAP